MRMIVIVDILNSLSLSTHNISVLEYHYSIMYAYDINKSCFDKNFKVEKKNKY